MHLGQRYFIILAAIAAALLPAQASAGVIDSCEPTPPSQALNGGTNPLAETFQVGTESDVDAIRIVAGDTGGSPARIAVVGTSADGTPDDTSVFGHGAIALPQQPGAVVWSPTGVRLPAGTYAVVVEPVGVMAWERCATADGGWFRDGDGKWNPFPQRRLTFSVEGHPADHTPPNVTFQPFASPTNAASVDIPFAADEPATFTCSVDGADPAACASPLLLDGPAEGDHTVAVTATDRWGNVAAPAETWIRIDRTPPVVTLTATASGGGSHAVGLTFGSDEPATFDCAWDGAARAPCTSPASFDAPAEGPLTITADAADAAGNTGSATAQVLVDWSPPDLVLPADMSVTADRADGAIVDFSASATDRWDPAVTTACTPASGSRLPVGDSLVLCTATDASGNAASGSFSVHVAAPPITAAELDIAFDRTSGALAFTETHGGQVDRGAGMSLTASAAGHTTVAQLGRPAGAHGFPETGVSILSLVYDGGAAVPPGRNAYSVRVRHGRDGSVRRITITAQAGTSGMVVRYRPGGDQSTVWQVTGDRWLLVGRFPGLVVPHLRTSGGTVAVALGA